MRPTAQEALSMFDRYVAEGKSREGAMAYVVGWVEANACGNQIEELIADADGIFYTPKNEHGWTPSNHTIAPLADWLRAQGGEE